MALLMINIPEWSTRRMRSQTYGDDDCGKMASNSKVQIVGLSTANGTIGGSKQHQSDQVPVIHQLPNGTTADHSTANCVNTRAIVTVNSSSNSVLPSKSSARAAREKALQEIRISLQPFANNERPPFTSNERPTSSASSTSDSSSSPRQTSGIGSSISSNYSALAFSQSRRNSANSTSTGLNPQLQAQLVKQLQNIGILGQDCRPGDCRPGHNDPNQAISYPQSPASLSSLYSSISSPPSHAASSSSGRQSPTPTISSSEYSVPAMIRNNANLQLQKKLSSPSSTCSSSHTPTSAAMNLARAGPVQAWTARQAISQSPVIMQSVKSTQVKKPVLQTAVAPTTPPINNNFVSLVTHPKTTSQVPLSSSNSFANNATSSNSSASASTNSNHLNTHHLLKNPPPYPFNNQQKLNGKIQHNVHSPVQECHQMNPPPSYASAMQQQQEQQKQQHQQQKQFQEQQPNLAETSLNQSLSPPPPPPPPPYFSPLSLPRESQQIISVLSQFDNDFNSTSIQVPTTEPPSYAFSVAALAAQRAAIANATASGLDQNAATTSRSNTVTNMRMPSRPPPMPPRNSDLVNTVESICTSQISALQGVANPIGSRRGPFDGEVPPLPPKPNQGSGYCSCVAESTGSECSIDSVSNASSFAPISNKSPAQSPPPPPSPAAKPHSQCSPIPPRKQLSKEKEKERRESKVKNYSPAAFKFFMEQHVENVIKSHQQRERRRQQLESEMAKVGLSEEAQRQMRKMLHQKESNYIRLRRAKMDRSMFKKIKTIGVGAFGEVALVRKTDTNQLYAMKTLRKSDVLKRNQVAHVKAERDILAEADNEWVVKLYYSFQDEDNLYFVMDYIPGGDLMSLLIKFGIFKEPLARFYIAELVLAVESVHKMGFIHRDIKPDNILIDRDGHIKLTDFGLCTGFRWTHNSKYYQRNNGIDVHNRQDSLDILNENWSNNTCHCNIINANKPLERRRRREHQRCLAHSLVGTPNYIAPEVLMRTGYTQLCDWWSVGVIMYEMLVGQPPFFANTPEETQNKVIHWDKTLRIPKEANLSQSASNLILGLCTGPENRLGKNGADEIKKHSFFTNIDFEGGLRRQTAPYIPEIKYPTDTSNFDPIDIDKLHPSGSDDAMFCPEAFDYVNSHGPFQENGKHPEHAFFEFTFRRFFDDGGQSYPIKITDSNLANGNSTDNGQGSPVYV